MTVRRWATSGFAECALDDLGVGAAVFDQQDMKFSERGVHQVTLEKSHCRAALAKRRSLCRGRRRRRRRRQPDKKRRTLTEVALDRDSSAVCLDNLVANREAGSRAVKFLAGMKPPEKLKNRRVKLRFDADAIVRHGNRHVVNRIGVAFKARRTIASLDNCVDFDPGIQTRVIFYAITHQICQ